MSTVRKFGWHLVAAAASVVVVFGVLAAGPVGVAQAAHTATIAPSTASPGSVVDVTASGVGTGNTVVFERLATSAATGSFIVNGGSTLACMDGAACDTSALPGVITVEFFISNNSPAGTLSISTSRSGYAGDVETATATVAAGAGTLTGLTVAGSSSLTNGGSGDYTIFGTDASGARVAVSNVTVSTTARGLLAQIAAQPNQCVALAADADGSTANDTSCTIAQTSASSASPTQVGVYENGSVGDKFTITAFVTPAGASPVVGQLEVTIAGVPASLTIDVEDTQVGVSQTVEVTVLDAGGNPVGPTTVTVAASEGVVACGTNTTSSGTLSCTYIAPATAQDVVITAIADVPASTQDVIASETITVSGAVPATPTPPAGGDAQFDRPIDDIGVNTAVWGGGTVTQLSAATAAAGGISVTVFVGGDAKVLIPGAPAFVNAEFNAAFPDGNVPAGTIVLVVR